jgi:beta-lactamase regulating signal transducer with metallopeptidase domain
LAILRHELAHYQRGDVWTSLVARLLAIPHWFNPFVWWAVRRFEEGSEWACDQRLLSNPHQVPAFARALLAMSEPKTNRVCTSAARGSLLSTRLRRLLCFQIEEDSMMKRIGLCSVLFCLVSVGLLRVHLVARAQEEAESREVDGRLLEERIAEFSERLDGVGQLQQFASALAAPAGRPAVAPMTSGPTP